MAKRLSALVLPALVFLLTISPPANAAAGQPYGLAAMLQLDHLPYLKADTLAGGQSSYDRNGGNNDYGYYPHADPSGDQVLLDLQGPGTVYRMWFTGFIPTDGNIKVYFDGEATPRISMLIADLVSGENPAFPSPLVGNELASSGGFYCYVPLPFSRSIRIVTNQNALWFYYNIGYHLYSPDTAVTTWTSAQDPSAAAALWGSAGSDPKGDGGNTTVAGTTSLAAGAAVTLLDQQGPRSISSIKLHVPGVTARMAAGRAENLLDNTWIKIYWDNESSPSVSAPIGSFFAMGHFGSYATRSLMAGIDDANNLYVYFPMPFQTRARVQLVNQTAASVNNIVYEIKHAPFTDSFADVGYFKTAYQYESHQKEDEKDILVIDALGAGHLVGVVASLAGPENHTLLEGDERIYVDDGQTPVIQGTGTEDFFNGGWYFKNGLFTLPSHGHTFHAASSGQDHAAAYRWFLQDAIPFRTHLRVGLEHGSRNSVTSESWTLAYYYYQPAARAVISDVLDVGKAASESSHAYAVSGPTWSGTASYTYDGVMDAYGSTDDGRAHRGTSQFRLAINPANDGVLLRRRSDQAIAMQKASVAVDGQPVGTWYAPTSNPYHRWRDDEFLIPAAFTSGKSAITIQLLSAAPSIDWSEFRYTAMTLSGSGATSSPTPAGGASGTPTATGTSTRTRTATATASATPTRTATGTTTPTRTATASPTAATVIGTPTRTPTATASPTATPTTPGQMCLPPVVSTAIPVGSSPKGIAADAATNRIFVSLFDDSSVAVVNTTTNLKTAVWSTGSRAHANAVAMTNNRLFVSLRDGTSVAVLDATTGALAGTTAVGALPYGIGGAGNRVWVANFASSSVSVLDATTRNVVVTTKVGDSPLFVIPDGTRAFVSYFGGGVAVLGADGAVQSRFGSLGASTFGIAHSAATNRLYVANREQHVLWAINLANGQIVKGTSLPQTPYALAMNPVTNRLFVVFADTNQVDVRDGATLERVAILSVGSQGDQGGDGIAVANGRVYVSNNAQGTVTVIADTCR